MYEYSICIYYVYIYIHIYIYICIYPIYDCEMIVNILYKLYVYAHALSLKFDMFYH